MIDVKLQKKLKAAGGDLFLDVEFKIRNGELVTLYGKSGAGKTSIFRMIAGLLNPDKGRIDVDEVVWLDTEKKINLPPQRRKIGFVFQEYALFPNMTVLENLKFALGKGRDDLFIKDLIDIVDLGDLQYRKPDTLSGGQKQRVALARALVQKPEILMLDEPLSALDYEIRNKLQVYILQVHKEFNLTTILISHDISEIIKMSDFLIELDHGKIIRQGIPAEVLTNHKISGKFQFVGEILNINRQDFIFIITVLIGKEIIKVVADEDEGKKLSIGDKVLIASKAFNPIIHKIN
ncbi:MAG: ABC transporter ATP-binding protein [Flavobacteriia bacterium]|nr:MAG: ABC transporter ATP-binding protein [Flavobacteriia bacterium]